MILERLQVSEVHSQADKKTNDRELLSESQREQVESEGKEARYSVPKLMVMA